MELKALEKNVIAQIKSSFSINSFTQCVNELVLNSLDAKSKAVSIRVNLQNYRIQIVDNGHGISRSDLDSTGVRYNTSKCHTLSDLRNNLKFYGYKGEALANIVQVSREVMISSRQKHSDETYTKTFEHGKCNVKLVKQRSSVGTTVTVEGFLYNLPVRQNCIKNQELEHIKKYLERLVIIHPQVSFTVRNDASGNIILSSRKTESVVSAFINVHPFLEDHKFTTLKTKKDKLCIQGVFYRDLHENKTLQYIYVNKRPIINKEAIQMINELFLKHKNTDGKQKFPIFIIHIKCPYSEIDLLLEPAKTVVYFKKIDQIKGLIEKMVLSFLGVKKCVEKFVLTDQTTNEFQVSQIEGAIKGCAKRKSREWLDVIPEKCVKITKETPLSNMNELQLPAYKNNKAHSKPALPIEIKKPSKIAVHVSAKTDIKDLNDSLYTNFPNDEKRGKDLIMEMFIRSLCVYQDEINNSKSIMETSSSLVENLDSPLISDPITPLHVNNKLVSVGVQVEETQLDPKISDKRVTHNNSDELIPSFNQQENRIRSQHLFDEVNDQKFIKTSHQNSPPFFNNIDNYKNDFDEDELFIKQYCSAPAEYDSNRCRDDIAISQTLFKRYSSDSQNHLLQTKKTSPFNFTPLDTFVKPKSKPFDKYACIFTEKSRKLEATCLENAQLSPIPKPTTDANQNTNTQVAKFNFQPDLQINENVTTDQPYRDVNMIPCYEKHRKQNLDETQVSRFFRRPTDKNFITELQKNIGGNMNFATSTVEDSICTYDTRFKYSPEKCKINLLGGVEMTPCKQRNTKRAFDISTVSRYFKNQKSSFAEEFARNIQENIRRASQPSNNKLFATDFKQSNKNTSDHFLEMFPKDSKEPPDLPDVQTVDPSIDLFQTNDDDIKDKSKEYISIVSNEDSKDGEIKSDLIITLDDSTEETKNCKPVGNEKTQINSQRKETSWVKKVNEYGKVVYVNEITGYCTYYSPKEDMNFNVAERYECMPKGTSPILKEYGPVDPMSPKSKEHLQKEIIKNYEDDLILVKWDKCINNRDPKAFFEEIYMERAKQFEDAILSVCKNDLAKHVALLFECRSFTKEIFNNFEVIGQVDCKFIAVLEKTQNLVLLFDQHAVHERVRLEMLLHGSGSSPQSIGNTITIFLSHSNLSLIKKQKESLNALGLKFKCIPDGIIVNKVPLCIYNKYKKGKSSLYSLTKSLINEVINTLKENNGILVATPKFLLDSLNSEACRGAIKFGDALSRNECVTHLTELAKCSLPFQCAHGRPTLTPLISLNKNEYSAKCLKVNLKKLKSD